jgi:hypothetical protein
MIQEMLSSEVRFQPGLQYFGDRVVERLYFVWVKYGKIENVTLKWGGTDVEKPVKVFRRKPKKEKL